MASFDPARPDFAPYGFTCVRWRPARMSRPDHHNEIELNFLPDGSVTYLLGGRKVKIEAGRLTVFWAAYPHQVVAHGTAAGYFVATIPLAWFLQWNLPGAFVQAILGGEVLGEPGPAPAFLDARRFAQWVDDLRRARADATRIVSLEIEARLLRLAHALPVVTTPSRRGRQTPVTQRRSSRGTPSEGGLTRVERIACFIARHYRDKLTVDDIARAVGLHPNYAMNLFQKTFGATLLDHVTQHRVSHAQRLLVTTDQKVVDVAFGSGFSSISRFNDAFRRACGCSPREYRRRNPDAAL